MALFYVTSDFTPFSPFKISDILKSWSLCLTGKLHGAIDDHAVF